MRVDLSPRLGGTHWAVANQPLTTVLLSFTFIPPAERCNHSSLTAGVEQSHELNLNLRFSLLWPSWLDHRVPTTPCTSRLKTKRLKTLSTYQKNIAWIKSSWYYSRNMGGGETFVIMSPPVQILGGTCPPCPPCPIGIDAPELYVTCGFLANFYGNWCMCVYNRVAPTVVWRVLSKGPCDYPHKKYTDTNKSPCWVFLS